MKNDGKKTPLEDTKIVHTTDDFSYPASEDIYNKSEQQEDIDPENISILKTPNEIAQGENEKNFQEDKSGDDLDIPGSELDDDAEKNGNEDEENNFYSLGGDAHNDLEEDKGE